MKSKVLNRIPGKKAKDAILEKKPPTAAVEAEAGVETLPPTAKAENWEEQEDKNRKSEARKEFEAAVRGKLKNSRKR